ncbi:TrmH family RNA methyltransferase [Patescibacteria group bacterium]|jgi:tRNA G18 (ribose-2'-O)-methylase SpoU|nr:TrmH family RNA methyltransferase [Patescibacteria group bacterium]
MTVPEREVVVILDSVRSSHNVGSIFRTAEALGVSKLHLCGTTPTPTDRFGRARADIAKVALGAEAILPWEYHESALACVARVRESGFQIVAVERDPRAVSLKAFQPPTRSAYVLGDEVRGVCREVLDAADTILEIPQTGKKESLNVSVAAGIVLYVFGRVQDLP